MQTASTRLNGFLVAAAVMVAILHYTIAPIPETWQWVICGITIILTGIPHGALDHLVAKKNHALTSRKFSAFSFYLSYFTRMALFGICWYLFPSLSVVIFLLLSAFHFGETDLPLKDSPGPVKPFILQTLYGLFILSAMVVAHRAEILPLISQLSAADTTALNLLMEPLLNRIIIVSGPFMALCLMTVAYLRKQRIEPRINRTIVYQTVSIISIVVLLPLPLAFAFYFGCWHSLTALSSIRNHLSASRGRRISWKWMVNQLLPYSLLAIAGIAILVILVLFTGYIQFPLLAAFIGLAILTAPHLHIMSEMYKVMRK